MSCIYLDNEAVCFHYCLERFLFHAICVSISISRMTNVVITAHLYKFTPWILPREVLVHASVKPLCENGNACYLCNHGNWTTALAKFFLNLVNLVSANALIGVLLKLKMLGDYQVDQKHCTHAYGCATTRPIRKLCYETILELRNRNRVSHFVECWKIRKEKASLFFFFFFNELK